MRKELKYIIAVIAALLIIMFPFIVPNTYWCYIACIAGIYTLLTVGFNILTGYTGLVSLGQAGFYGISGYVTSICTIKLGFNPWISMAMGILVTMIFGVILALPALRVKDKYLVLLTIGFAEIVRLVALNWIKVTNGPSGISGVKAPVFFGLKLGTPEKFYYLVVVCVIFAFIYQRMLIYSRAGRAFIAIREDEAAAQLMGINLTNYKIKSFIISALFSSIAGVLYAHLVHYVSPDTYTYNESVMVLCMGIIGGMGTLYGPLIGGVLLTVIPEFLRQYLDYRMIIYGILLVAVIMLSPSGIMGTYERIKILIAKRRYNKMSSVEMDTSQRGGK